MDILFNEANISFHDSPLNICCHFHVYKNHKIKWHMEWVFQVSWLLLPSLYTFHCLRKRKKDKKCFRHKLLVFIHSCAPFAIALINFRARITSNAFWLWIRIYTSCYVEFKFKEMLNVFHQSLFWENFLRQLTDSKENFRWKYF